MLRAALIGNANDPSQTFLNGINYFARQQRSQKGEIDKLFIVQGVIINVCVDMFLLNPQRLSVLY